MDLVERDKDEEMNSQVKHELNMFVNHEFVSVSVTVTVTGMAGEEFVL